jgi:hypothetical protein
MMTRQLRRLVAVGFFLALFIGEVSEVPPYRGGSISMAGVLARVNIWHRQSLPLSACGEHQFEFFWRNGVAEVLDTPLRGLAHLVEYGPEALGYSILVGVC